jgi:hypothetical protein
MPVYGHGAEQPSALDPRPRNRNPRQRRFAVHLRIYTANRGVWRLNPPPPPPRPGGGGGGCWLLEMDAPCTAYDMQINPEWNRYHYALRRSI